MAQNLLPLKAYEDAIQQNIGAIGPAAGIGFGLPWGLFVLVATGGQFIASLIIASIGGLFFGVAFPRLLKPMMVRMTTALYAETAQYHLADGGKGRADYCLLCTTRQGWRQVNGVIGFGRHDTTFTPAGRTMIGLRSASFGPPAGVAVNAVRAPTGIASWMPWKLGGIQLRSSTGSGFYHVPEPEFTANAVAQVLEKLAVEPQQS